MKLCSYTNFEALFSTVDIDFCFLTYIKICEIAKFVYCSKTVNFVTLSDKGQIIKGKKFAIMD